jgi:ribonuclease R
MAKRRPIKDPFAEREAGNYENPIPSREFIADYIARHQGPMSHHALASALDIKGEEQEEALMRRLHAMVRDSQLLQNRKGDFAPIDKLDLILGRVQGHRDGYGFVLPNDGSDDLYLFNRQMRRVFDGDEVLVHVSGMDKKGRREGKIVEVTKRNTEKLVGRFYRKAGFGIVIPDNQRINQEIIIPLEASQNAKEGQFVVTRITEQPGRRNQPAGEISEVLGDHMDPGMEIDVAIHSWEIPNTWPDELLAEASQLSSEPEEADKLNRVDLRNYPLVTIDGEDAKDFDDAVYCEKKKGGGWRLWVAIADVSHYVPVGSALDKEAHKRSTSVYFPERVVPMLPEVISNGLCSLNPHLDRLCMVCEMTVSAKGLVSGYQFYEAVMHSHARLTYTEVGKMLDEENDGSGDRLRLREQFSDIVPHLEDLHDLYQALSLKRKERGAIEFETVETQILFGRDRKIEAIVPRTRNNAHKLIEECMLCANVSAARFIEKHKLDGLFRVHTGPTSRKLTGLREYLSENGLGLRGGDKPSPADYQELMQDIEGRPDQNIIQTMMLRSMSQAMYQPDNKGHFGLAYTAYAHFTSPIRRYPDLLVHRAIRHVIRSNEARFADSKLVRRVEGAPALNTSTIYPYNTADMVALGEHCSMAERRADDATRDVVSWLKCEYLQDHVGDTFAGVVTAATGFGLFVELSDVYVEGLVHITSLANDYYHFDTAKQRLVGERNGVSYQLGDLVTVQVASVNLDDRKIDLLMLDNQSHSAKDRKRLTRAATESKNSKKTSANKKRTSGSNKKSSGRKNAGKNNNERKPDGSASANKKRRSTTRGKKAKGKTGTSR